MFSWENEPEWTNKKEMNVFLMFLICFVSADLSLYYLRVSSSCFVDFFPFVLFVTQRYRKLCSYNCILYFFTRVKSR